MVSWKKVGVLNHRPQCMDKNTTYIILKLCIWAKPYELYIILKAIMGIAMWALSIIRPFSVDYQSTIAPDFTPQVGLLWASNPSYKYAQESSSAAISIKFNINQTCVDPSRNFYFISKVTSYGLHFPSTTNINTKQIHKLQIHFRPETNQMFLKVIWQFMWENQKKYTGFQYHKWTILHFKICYGKHRKSLVLIIL